MAAATGSEWFVAPVATAPAGGGGRALGWAIIAGMAVSAALLVGLVAVADQLDTPRGRLVRDWLALGVGPLLVALGLAAMWSAGESTPALAGVAGGVGTVGAWALSTANGRASTSRGESGPGPDGHALRTVVRHRAVEGTALAGAYVAGSAVGILGAVVLASHVTAKTAAIGGLYGTSRVRTTSRALLLQGVFLAGAVGGLALVGGPPPVVQQTALALAGGVLAAVGAVETGTHAPRPPSDRD
jgi:hypothetical protein